MFNSSMAYWNCVTNYVLWCQRTCKQLIKLHPRGGNEASASKMLFYFPLSVMDVHYWFQTIRCVSLPFAYSSSTEAMMTGLWGLCPGTRPSGFIVLKWVFQFIQHLVQYGWIWLARLHIFIPGWGAGIGQLNCVIMGKRIITIKDHLS